MTKIEIVLEVGDGDEALDPTHSSGLTTAAYNDLVEAIQDRGFQIFSGPTRVEE
jgi:hypothetical protein